MEEPYVESMSDTELIALGRWEEGEPMNEYAEEYERRHGFATTTPKD